MAILDMTCVATCVRLFCQWDVAITPYTCGVLFSRFYVMCIMDASVGLHVHVHAYCS